MAQRRSQDYDVDNRYSQTESAVDNAAGKKHLKNYIERDRVRNVNPIAPDNKDENKFVIPGQGGLVPIPNRGSIGNTDSRITFRNSFRASQKETS